MVAWLGPLISAGASLAGGIMANNQRDEEIKRQNEMAQANINLQKEFAQNSIQWRKADAEKAGVNPHFALGAQGISFSPISLGGAPEGKNWLADMGQDVSRAVAAGATANDRTKMITDALSVKNMELQNGLLSAQIRKLNASVPVPDPDAKPTVNALGPISTGPIVGGPVPEKDKPEERPQLHSGKRWLTHPWFTNAEDWEKRYGDVLQEIIGMGINLPADAYWNLVNNEGFRGGVESVRGWKAARPRAGGYLSPFSGRR